MGRGDTSLASTEYDGYLASKGRVRELKDRHRERKTANKGYEGWHFGLGEKPVHTRDKVEFKRELEKRGLMMGEDVRRNLK